MQKIKKFISFVMKKFSSEEISGQITFVKPTRILQENYIAPAFSNARILAETDKAPAPKVKQMSL